MQIPLGKLARFSFICVLLMLNLLPRIVSAEAPRVAEGLQALYVFNAGAGNTVFDVSEVGVPLDLTIPDSNKVTWGQGTLSLVDPTRIESSAPATKLRTAMQATNELTLEAWIEPGSDTQGGPGPIVTMSFTPFYRGIALHQNVDNYEVNLSTTYTGNQGNSPLLSSTEDAVQLAPLHVVYTREASGAAKLYIDNELVSSGHVGGTYAIWRSDMKLALGNELRYLNRPWLGTYNLLAFYDRALSTEEIDQNYMAGADAGDVDNSINIAPMAINDAVNTDTATAVSGNVLSANGGDADSDANGDPLAVVSLNGIAATSATLVSGALVNLSATGEFSYDPNGRFDGLGPTAQDNDSFDYTISDGRGGESSATVTVLIIPLNTPPVAQNDAVSTDEDTLITGNVLVDNGAGLDADANGDTLEVLQVNGSGVHVGVEVSLSSGASLTVEANGDFSYNPSGNFNYLSPGGQEIEAFTYTIGDGRGGESSATVSIAIDGLEESAVPPRAEAGLQALYTFNEGSGNTVFDVSEVGVALDLIIPDENKVSWGSGSLSLDDPTRIESSVPATKLRTAMQATNELTLEAWIEPGSDRQGGPGPIVTLSFTPFYRGVALHQNADKYEVNLSTNYTGNQGNSPLLRSPDNAVLLAPVHVVYTRDASGAAKLYIDNVLVSNVQVGGNLSPWRSDMKLALGNELRYLDRPWLGTYDLLAFYDRALNVEEIEQNYEAGADAGDVDNSINIAPMAIDDAVNTDTATVVTGNVLLANGGATDSDANGDPLMVVALNGTAATSATLESGALVELSATGEYSYNPNGQFDGLGVTAQDSDSFEYTISDGRGGESSATVSVMIFPVNSPPVAQNDAVITDEDAVLFGDVFVDNGSDIDSDPNGDPLQVAQVNGESALVGVEISLTSGALLTVNVNGDFSYDPRGSFDNLILGAQGSDEFAYGISDGLGGVSDAVVTITIDGLEEPAVLPRVQGGMQALYTFNEGSGDTVFDVSEVGNALDLTIPDSDKVSWGLGTLSLDAPTKIESLLPATKLSTAMQATNALTLEAWIEPGSATQGGPGPIVTMSFTPFYRGVALHQNVDNYEVNLSTNYSGNQGNSPLLQSPNNAVQLLPVHVVYTRDASGAAKLYINNELVSSVQVGGNLSTWRSDMKLALGNELRYLDRPWLGTYNLLAFYDRALSLEEIEQNYVAGAGVGDMNLVPMAVNDVFNTDEDTAFTGNVLANNGSGIDADPNGDPLQVLQVNQLNGESLQVGVEVILSSGALLTLNENGDFNYDPNGSFDELIHNEQGSDGFTYTIGDGREGESSATVSVLIAGLAEPDLIAPPTPAGLVAQSTTSTTATLIWDAVVDEEGGSGLQGYVVRQVGRQPVLVTTTTYTAPDLISGTSYAFTVSAIDNLDNDSAESSPVPAITNVPPVAVGDTVTTDATTVATGNVLSANGGLADSDVNDDLLIVVALNTEPVTEITSVTLVGGALVTLSATGGFSYDPNGQFADLGENEQGSDSFGYTISDGNGGESSATVSVTILPVNASPVAQDDTLSTDEDTAITGSLFADNGNGMDVDLNGDTLQVLQVDGGGIEVGVEVTLISGALLTVEANGDYSYDPNGSHDNLIPGLQAIETFTYTIGDGRGAESSATVVIEINGLDEPDLTAPPAPETLTVTVVSSQSLSLTWTAVVDEEGGSGLSGYEVSRGSVIHGAVVLGVFTELSFVDDVLDPESIYSYTVVALDEAGNRSESVSASEMTSPDTLAPEAPGQLEGTALSSTEIELTWVASVDQGGSEVVGYEISRDEVVQTTVSGTSFVDTGLNEDSPYSYEVRAIDDASTPNVSDPSTVSVMSLPPYAECPILSVLPLNHFTFDGAEPGILLDGTGVHDGSVSGVILESGLIRNALSFGTGSYATLGNYDPDLSAGLTISLWVKPDEFGDADARFLSKADGVNSSDHYLMVGAYQGNALRFRLKTNNVTTTLISPANVLVQDQWQLVTFTYDFQQMKIYHNGILQQQVNNTGAININPSIAMAIGDQPVGAGPRRPFSGAMDDLRIYNKALSQTEILSLNTHRAGDCSVLDVTPPAAPSGLTATDITWNRVVLYWNAVEDLEGSGLRGYLVQRLGADPVEVLTDASVEVTNLEPDSVIIFNVVSQDNAGNVSAAQQIEVAIPEAPLPSISVSIVSPDNDALFNVGDSQSFTGQVSDSSFDESIVWVSDLEGSLGTGSTINHTFTSTGVQEITASVADPDGVVASNQIVVTVVESLPQTPTEPIALFDGTTLDDLYAWYQYTGFGPTVNDMSVVDNEIRVLPAPSPTHPFNRSEGYLSTDDSYTNYIAVLEFRWGDVNLLGGRIKDAGLIVHSNGLNGGWNGRFIPGIEVQQAEGSMGDLILLKNNNDPITLTTDISALECGPFTSWNCRGGFVWDPLGVENVFADSVDLGLNFGHVHNKVWDKEWQNTTGFRGEIDYENPDGDWNQLVAISSGNQIDVYFNGEWVNSARDVFPTSGKLQVQLEWSEYFIRRFELLPLLSNVGPIISNHTIPTPVLNSAFEFTLDADTMNAPVTWTMSSGTLPIGLSFDALLGKIEGLPVESGNSTFTIEIEDSVGQISQETYTLTIQP